MKIRVIIDFITYSLIRIMLKTKLNVNISNFNPLNDTFYVIKIIFNIIYVQYSIDTMIAMPFRVPVE